MISCKHISEYIDYVNKNPDKVGEDVHLLIKNVALPALQSDEILFDEEMLDKCINFCEKWYYPLFPYQKFLYAFVFMYRKDNPDVVAFKEIFQLMARGNGKDGMLMPLASFLLTPMYGVKNYHIDIVANAEDQAINSFNVVYNMLEENKEVMSKMFYWNKVEIMNLHTKSRLRYNTSNAKTKDGKQTGMIIFNELHSYEDYGQLNVFTSGLGKIKHARIWTITTNGYVREGPLDEKIDIANRVLNGGSNLLGMFPFLARIKNEEDVHKPVERYLETGNRDDIDYSNWIKANPSLPYMPILKEQILDDYIRMTETPSFKAEFYTKRMNMPMVDEEITVTSWENILKASYIDVEHKIPRPTPELYGKSAVVGIDFASVNDFVSAGFLFKVGDEYIWRQKTWINSNGRRYKEIKFPFSNLGSLGFEDFEIVDTATINERIIVGWIYEQMTKYNVQKINLDSYRYDLIKRAFEEYGIDVQTKDNPNGMVQLLRRTKSINAIVAPYIERLFVEGNLNIGNSAIMRWAINNTSMKQLKDGNYVFEKIEEKLRKNDPFMALVHALYSKELLEEEAIYMEL